MEQADILIIGSGEAAVAAAEAARKQDPDVSIRLMTAEANLPFYRLRLCEKIAEPDKSLTLHPEAWYAERGLELKLNCRAERLDPEAKCVYFADGGACRYDKLIIATGSRSFVPPIQGADGRNVFTLWTLEDASAIAEAARDAKEAAVIGGGLLGLEAAHKLLQTGTDVTVIENADRLLARQTDRRASELFLKKTEAEGIKVHLDDSAEAIRDEGGRKVLKLQSGAELSFDLVLISTGVRANTDWLEGSGIAIDRRIKVDDHMRTSLPDVYAAGDVAVQDGLWFGLWSIAMQQGRTAGANAAGGEVSYPIETPPYIINTMGTSMASAGLYPDEKQPYETLEADEEAYSYRRIIYQGEDPEGPVKGYILLGNIREYPKLQKRLAD